MNALKNLLLFALCIMLVIVAGCSSSRDAVIKHGMTTEQIIRAIEKRNTEIFSLRGRGEISIDTPELSNSGNISVTLLKPDSLLIEITGPFNVGIAKGLVTTKDFKFYNGIENKLFLGSTSAKNIKSIMRLSIEFPDIINLFTGSMSFSHHPSDVAPQGTWKGSEYSIVYKGKDETVEYVIDTDYESIIRYSRKDMSGETLEEVRFKGFKRKSDYYLPEVISLSRPPLEQSFTLVYESQMINERPLDFTLKVPAGAVKVQM